jgi:hypothetical protein
MAVTVLRLANAYPGQLDHPAGDHPPADDRPLVTAAVERDDGRIGDSHGVAISWNFEAILMMFTGPDRLRPQEWMPSMLCVTLTAPRVPSDQAQASRSGRRTSRRWNPRHWTQGQQAACPMLANGSGDFTDPLIAPGNTASYTRRTHAYALDRGLTPSSSKPDSPTAGKLYTPLRPPAPPMGIHVRMEKRTRRSPRAGHGTRGSPPGPRMAAELAKPAGGHLGATLIYFAS